MRITIKDFSIKMELKNKGIELEIRNNNDEFLGDFILNKAGLVWCQGKQSKKNGTQKTWEEVIEFFTKQ